MYFLQIILFFFLLIDEVYYSLIEAIAEISFSNLFQYGLMHLINILLLNKNKYIEPVYKSPIFQCIIMNCLMYILHMKELIYLLYKNGLMHINMKSKQ